MAIVSVPPMMVTAQTTTVVMTATVRKVTVTMTTRVTARMMTSTATTARKITVMAATHPMVETRSMEVKAVGEVTTGVPRRVGEEEVTPGVPSGVPRRVGVVTVGKVVRNAVRQPILDALVAIPTSETRCC